MTFAMKQLDVDFIEGVGKMSYDFQNEIRACEAALSGFEMSFGEEDREIKSLGVQIENVSYDETVATVLLKFNLQDDSSHFGTGSATVVILADVGPAR